MNERKMKRVSKDHILKGVNVNIGIVYCRDGP